MKKLLLPVFILIGQAVLAQTALYGITGSTPGSVKWNRIQQFTNRGPSLLLDAAKPSAFINATTAAKAVPKMEGIGNDITPGAQGIAALAYDKLNNRLYFAPMFRSGGLRYISLEGNTAQRPVLIYDESYLQLDRAKDGEGQNITRMVIAEGGVGYALSNDGNYFLRFGTGNKTNVEQLGPLVDHEKNGAVSVHNKCMSWGGDIIAADNGKLYLFTLNRNVFEIDPNTRMALHLGQVEGLENNFTINGAAVNEKNQIILASSIVAGTRYVLNGLDNLKAIAEVDATWMNASDLASPFTLKTNISKLQPAVTMSSNDRINAYPNPVSSGRFTVTFTDVASGKYELQMVGSRGNLLQSKSIQINRNGQTESVSVANYAKGFYLLRVNNANGTQIATQKIIVQ